MKTLPIRTVGYILMFAAYAMFFATLIWEDMGLIARNQAGISVAVWLTLAVVGAVITDAKEL